MGDTNFTIEADGSEPRLLSRSDILASEPRKKKPEFLPKEILSGSKSMTTEQEKITDTVFVQDGTIFSVQPKGNRGIDHGVLPPANYAVKNSMKGFYLEVMVGFPKMGKIYGDAYKIVDRVLNTYEAKKGNLGVLLDGVKGSGKTLTARLISQRGAERGIPTLVINSPYCGEDFFQFLYSIQQPCIVLFDEFEKVFDERDQQALLTLLDGTFPSNKLFLFTSNDQSKINAQMRNRPGRVHYYVPFKGLSGSFVKEYIQDNLKEKAHERELLSVCSMFSTLNFDTLAALVWEMNLYKEPAGQAVAMLNAMPESAGAEFMDVDVSIKGVPGPILRSMIGDMGQFRGSPLSFSSYTAPLILPAIPELAAKALGVKVELLDEMFGPSVYEESRSLLKAVKGKENKVDWTEHYAFAGKRFLGGVDMAIIRVHSQEGYVLSFTSSDIRGIDIETGTHTYVNAAGNTLKLTRRQVVEHSPYDYLRMMD